MGRFSLVVTPWLVFALVAIEVLVCFLIANVRSKIAFGMRARLIVMVIAEAIVPKATRESLFRVKAPAARNWVKRLVQSGTYGRYLTTE